MSRIEITEDTLTPTFKRAPATIRAALWATVQMYAPRVQGQAQNNAPWTDQTSNARTGLKARAGKHEGVGYHIDLFHTMPYGIWLETRWSGRLATIMPTIQQMAPEVFDTAGKAVMKLTSGGLR